MGEKVGVLKHFKVPEKIPLDPVTIPWTLWRRCLLSPGYKWYSWPSRFPQSPGGPSPQTGQVSRIGRGIVPVGIPWGPQASGPKTQPSVPWEAQPGPESFPSHRLPPCRQRCTAESASPSAYLCTKRKGKQWNFPCLMIEITLKVVEMP